MIKPYGNFNKFFLYIFPMLILITLALTTRITYAHPPTYTFHWGDYDWMTTSGPSNCRNWGGEENAYVDKTTGELHLLLNRRADGQWYCAEIQTQQALGFGTYIFEVKSVSGGSLPENVVFGMFNYLSSAYDRTNEIDIEFSRWSNPNSAEGNYNVWPNNVSQASGHATTFNSNIAGGPSTHTFEWSPKMVTFKSTINSQPRGWWAYTTADYQKYIPQNPLYVHINLWLHSGDEPADGKDIEVILKRFTYSGRSY